MKKILTFLLTALLAFSVGWAAEGSVSYAMNSSSPAAWSPGNSSGANTCVSPEGFTIYLSSSNATKSDYIGWNSNNTTMTISHETYFLKSIYVYATANGTASAYNISLKAGGGTVQATSTTQFNWTAGDNNNTHSVSFTYVSGQQFKINRIIIEYETDGGSTGPTEVATIADAYALAQDTQFTFTGNAVVTYQNGNNLWIRDDSGSGLIFGSGVGTYSNGNILNSGWTATNVVYNGIPEFTNPSGVSLSSQGSTVDPLPLTTLTTGDVNKYASLSNVTISSASGNDYYTEIGGTTFHLRNQYGLDALTQGKTYNVVGIVTIYSNDIQFNLISATEVTSGDPTIFLSPTSLDINDSGTNNTFTVEASNLVNNDQGNVGVSASSNEFGLGFSSSTNETATWGFLRDNNFAVNGTVAVNYTGRALSANTTVTAATQGDSKSVAVNYVADLYIVTDYGHNTDNGYSSNGWDFANGTSMANNNGIYTATFTADLPNTYIVFARKLGESDPWNTRSLLGPSSSGNWWLPTTGNGNGSIDVNNSNPIKIQGAGTYTVTIDANNYTFTIEKEAESDGYFVLVTDATQLAAGNEVIFVNRGDQGDGLAMSTTQNANNRGTTAVTVSPMLRVAATEETQIATLEGNADGWYFNVGTAASPAYLYAASSNSNYLRTRTEKGDDNSKATISISNNEATIRFQGSYTRNLMRFNGNIVSCYSSGQSPVFIYQRAASTEPSITVNPASLELVIPAGGTSQEGTVAVTESNTTGTTSVSITGDDASYFTATLNNGTLTVTYTGTATASDPDVAVITLTNGTASATVTVTGYKRAEAGGTLYTKVTSSDQIQDGLQYILVYEGTPEAMNGITSGGTGTAIAWETQGSVVNVSGTDVIEFTLNGDASAFTVSCSQGYMNPATAPNLTFGVNGENWSAESNNGGYVLKYGSYMLRYNSGASVANGRFRIYDGTTGQPVYLYVQGEAGLATPVISPDSGNYPEDQTVTITCATSDATIYYTINGGETLTYTDPFTVDLDEDNTEVTIVAWAEKDGETSNQAIATYTYKSDKVYSIAEFLALKQGDEVYFQNPVTVLFDYSQNSANGQEYIWIKDRTGYTQLFIAPQFDATSLGGANEFVPKYENGDVIPAGFKVKKDYYSNGEYYQGQCYEWHATFQDATEKALADPEQVLLSELLENPADYNNRYLYINKLQVSDVSGLNFSVSADENGDNVSEVAGGSAIVGYNKYNSPAWKNKQGDVVGVTLPTDDKYYNVTFIFQSWQNGYEIMPIEFTEWQDNSVRLEDLVATGVEDNQYTISNTLIAARVTWDDSKGKFAIFAKDDEMYANKRYPAEGQETYLIEFESQDGTFVNTVEQADYDQSNWIEILIPSDITDKTTNPNAYESALEDLKSTYQNKILAGGSISGTYVDALNPTIEVFRVPTVEVNSTYTPNIYCTGNFLAENIDADGAMSYRDDELGGEYFFFMDSKPQEFCKVVWAYFIGNDNYFVAPAQEGYDINGHKFRGSFLADMSLCEDYRVSAQTPVANCFSPSNSYGEEQMLYGFEAIVRKNPAAWNGGSNGAPSRIQPYEDGKESTPLYIVYPLSQGSDSSDNVTAVEEVAASKTVKSVRYYNLMGMESEQPFQGINIVVTRYSDGSISTVKVMR